MAQKVPKRANEGVREGQNGERKGKEGKKAVNGLLAHPFSCENGLLSTLSGKGWTKRPFSWGSSSQCEALRAFSTRHFSTLLGHFGSFWGLLGLICYVPKSAKSHSTGPQSPMVRPKWRKTQNWTPWCGVECILSDFGEVEF